MSKLIKIGFSDFWFDFNPNDNYFITLLKRNFNVELSDNPDFLIFSVYSKNHRKYNCTKILFTGENVRPDYIECDYSISFDYSDYGSRNIRFPLYNLYDDVLKLKQKKDPQTILNEKTKFCNMVVSNPRGRERVDFFNILNKRKKVDSGGRYMNNIGKGVENKRKFIKDYKFTIAFENSSYPGYTTEKIFEPMLENSIPVYWGNPLVNTDFNIKGFINVHDYKSFEEVAEYILFLDENDEAYLNILKEPWLVNNELTSFSLEENLVSFFKNIFNNHHHNILKGGIKNLITELSFFNDKFKYLYLKKRKWNA